MDDFLSEKQKEDLRFFHSKLDDLLGDPIYRHKYVLIHNKNIEGFFDTFENALAKAVVKFPPGEYIIQQIISSTEISEFLYPALATA